MAPPTANELAQLCFKQFDSLPKTGKPTSGEWTVLSGILLHNSITNETKVVALGCGTKCVGQSKLCSQGLILNDSHAEVLARRAFMRYLYQKLAWVISTNNSETESDNAFQWSAEKLEMQLKPGNSFHFVSTQAPCGDACIDDAQSTATQIDESFVGDDETPKKKSKLVDNEVNIDLQLIGAALSNKESSTETVFTGAKLIGAQHSDAMDQSVGAVRTKPGRGNRTLSMSCSDKLARWNVLGIQGALLDVLLEAPIYLQTLNFCCSCNVESVKRAIYARFCARSFQTKRFQAQQPEIRVCCSDLQWKFAHQPEQQPSPNGLAWCETIQHSLLNPYEISVNGKRQGITEKKLHTPQAALRISKYHLLKSFIELLESWEPKLLQKFHLESEQLKFMKYGEYKGLSLDYQSAWIQAKRDYFQQWTQKSPNLLGFCLAAVET